MASFERKEAVICAIGDLLNGKYYKMPGWDPNFVLLRDRIKASRVNILGVITTKSNEDGYASLTIDDGSGTIMMRSFEEQNFEVSPGDAALVIGRPRDFSGNLYLVPEIVRRIENMKWVDYRQRELEILEEKRKSLPELEITGGELSDHSSDSLENSKLSTKISTSEEHNSEPSPESIKSSVSDAHNEENENTPVKETDKGDDSAIESNNTAENSSRSDESLIDDKKPRERTEKKKSDTERIYEMIGQFDGGDGAEISRILDEAEKEGIENAEKALRMMLEIGDIFEIKAGKVKVL